MSGHTVSHYVLTCDRCETTIGENGPYRTATEARAAAYTQGWRFPAKRLPSGRRSSRSDDVCGPCTEEEGKR